MTESQIVRSYAKSVNQAPRKVALVASLVRSRKVADAVVILAHTPKRAALAVKKAIESAQANAINNHGLDSKTLKVSKLSVTSSVRMKRAKANAMGRPRRFEKKTSNILVEVTGDIKPKKPSVQRTNSGKTTKEKEKK